jgi:hypothetical protein
VPTGRHIRQFQDTWIKLDNPVKCDDRRLLDVRVIAAGELPPVVILVVSYIQIGAPPNMIERSEMTAPFGG